MGQKGGNLFRYLPGDFPPTQTKWLTEDNGDKKAEPQLTNATWRVNPLWAHNGSQRGTNTASSAKSNVALYAVEGDSAGEGKQNHNTRNDKKVTIMSVYEPGVHESVKELKEYSLQKNFLETGGQSKANNNGQGHKPGSMYEKVGLEFTHQ